MNSSLCSSNTSSLDECAPVEGSTNYFLVCVYAVCIILVYTGNAMTVIVIARYETLRKPSNFFIMSLSMADIFVGVATPLYVILNYIDVRHMTDGQEKWLCIVTLSLIVFSGCLSLYSLLAISIDRFIAVFYPFNHADWLSMKRVVLIISCMWSLFFCLALMPSFGVHQWRPGIECTYVKVHARVFLLFVLGPFVGSGLFFSQFFYCRIFYRAYQQRKQIAIQTVQTTVSKEEKKKQKQAKLMAFVLAIFLVCWTPYTACNALIGALDSAPYWLIVLMEIAKVIVFCNSFINPLIYGWKSMEFRRAYFKLLGCDARGRDVPDFINSNHSNQSNESKMTDVA